jgi:hypothetical protein
MRCPNGHKWVLPGVTLTNVGIRSAGPGFSIFGAPCTVCGETGTEDVGGPLVNGVYSTDPRGRLRIIRELSNALNALGPDALRVLRDDLAIATDANDSAGLAEALQRAGLGSAFAASVRADPWGFASMILTVLFYLLQLHSNGPGAAPLQPQQIEQICTSVIEKQQTTSIVTSSGSSNTVSKRSLTRTTIRPIGRNEACPCGNGSKYKKCHGRHPSIPDPAGPPSIDPGTE